jgi:hypothetical protein
MSRRVLNPFGAGDIMRVVPVKERVVKLDANAVSPTSVNQFAIVVPLERSAHDVVVGEGSVKKAETVVVFCGDGDLAHPCFLRQLNPFVGIEFGRVELVDKLLVFVNGNLGVVHDPLSDARDSFAFPFTSGDCVESPVDEHAELRFPPPSKSVRLRLLSSCHSSKQHPPHSSLTSKSSAVVPSKI